MNFRNRKEPALPRVASMPGVDMAELERQIENERAAQLAAADEAANAISEFAPPDVRRQTVPHEGPIIQHVSRFAELPTAEIDEVLRAAREEIEALEKKAQMVRDLYIRATNQISADVRRLREGVRLSMETMEQLRGHCQGLNGELKQEATVEKKVEAPAT
jgi:hypothetical protein